MKSPKKMIERPTGSSALAFVSHKFLHVSVVQTSKPQFHGEGHILPNTPPTQFLRLKFDFTYITMTLFIHPTFKTFGAFSSFSVRFSRLKTINHWMPCPPASQKGVQTITQFSRRMFASTLFFHTQPLLGKSSQQRWLAG